MSTNETRRLWAACGAMALTGDPDGPGLVAPPRVVERIAVLGSRLGVDALALLGERAAVSGFSRRGATSCGGATRLLATRDGWIAVSLARPDDIDAVPAWLEVPPTLDPWETAAEAAARRHSGWLVERAVLLSLPVAAVGEALADVEPVVAVSVGAAPGPTSTPPLVVDLSSLWAGPLCAHLLGLHGCRVVKVEATGRPDGARGGPARFFDLLHAGHESVALDFTDERDVARLRALLDAADVVVEASRPRAIEQLGVDAVDVVAHGPRVWVSISGYGRSDPGCRRVAFGDDAAVAGGLVAWCSDGTPRFVADAVADPLTGLVAANAVLAALEDGGRVLLDIAMARVAASVAADSGREPWLEGRANEAAQPRHRDALGGAPRLGEHSDAVLSELGIR